MSDMQPSKMNEQLNPSKNSSGYVPEKNYSPALVSVLIILLCILIGIGATIYYLFGYRPAKMAVIPSPSEQTALKSLTQNFEKSGNGIPKDIILESKATTVSDTFATSSSSSNQIKSEDLHFQFKTNEASITITKRYLNNFINRGWIFNSLVPKSSTVIVLTMDISSQEKIILTVNKRPELSVANVEIMYTKKP